MHSSSRSASSSKRHSCSHSHSHWHWYTHYRRIILVPGTFIFIFLIQRIFFSSAHHGYGSSHSQSPHSRHRPSSNGEATKPQSSPQATVTPTILHIGGQWKQVREALSLPPLQDEILFIPFDPIGDIESNLNWKLPPSWDLDSNGTPNRSLSLFPSRFFKRHFNPKRDFLSLNELEELERDCRNNLKSNGQASLNLNQDFVFTPPPVLFFSPDSLHEPKLSTEDLVRLFKILAMKDEKEIREHRGESERERNVESEVGMQEQRLGTSIGSAGAGRKNGRRRIP